LGDIPCFRGQTRHAGVSAILGVKSDFAREKDYLTYVLDRIIAQPTGVWGLKSRSEATVLDRHVEDLLDVVEKRRDDLQRLVKDRQLSINVVCVWVGRRGHGGPWLSAPTVSRLAALGASLTFDIYDVNWELPEIDVHDIIR
jgi:hypothetical protein